MFRLLLFSFAGYEFWGQPIFSIFQWLFQCILDELFFQCILRAAHWERLACKRRPIVSLCPWTFWECMGHSEGVKKWRLSIFVRLYFWVIFSHLADVFFFCYSVVFKLDITGIYILYIFILHMLYIFLCNIYIYIIYFKSEPSNFSFLAWYRLILTISLRYELWEFREIKK